MKYEYIVHAYNTGPYMNKMLWYCNVLQVRKIAN